AHHQRARGRDPRRARAAPAALGGERRDRDPRHHAALALARSPRGGRRRRRALHEPREGDPREPGHAAVRGRMTPVAPLQVLDPSGKVRGELPALPPEKLVALYEAMVRTRILDTRMLALQRQGRIGFYGTCKGQEAATVGSALAVEEQDWVFPAL